MIEEATCPECKTVLEVDENGDLYCPLETCPLFMINPEEGLDTGDDEDEEDEEEEDEDA
jgi:uncharacterized Zn finger protein (UPF0148 family)